MSADDAKKAASEWLGKLHLERDLKGRAIGLSDKPLGDVSPDDAGGLAAEPAIAKES